MIKILKKKRKGTRRIDYAQYMIRKIRTTTGLIPIATATISYTLAPPKAKRSVSSETPFSREPANHVVLAFLYFAST